MIILIFIPFRGLIVKAQNRPSERTERAMKHRLRISVSREPPSMTLVRCRKVTMREKFLRLLFGEKSRVTVLVTGDTVETVSIEEIAEGGSIVGSG